ncbi:MAG: hypothetical protein HFE92_03695 [Acutalibacter muris]|nr:hypothetical protein [Acutalibacter muris]
MKTPSVHSKKPQEALELKAIIASLLDQARDKVSFVDRDAPDDIFTLDIRMLHEAVHRLHKMQAKPIIVSTAKGREYIDYICPHCRDTITQRRKVQKEWLYRPKYHDSCGQQLNWEKMAIRGKLKIKKSEASK